MLAYAGASVLCVVFSLVYGIYSHGVHSNYMTWLFAIPLAGGALSMLLPEGAAVRTWGSGVITLGLGSCLMGVLQIYGTTSPYMAAYPIAGSALLVLAVVLAMLRRTG